MPTRICAVRFGTQRTTLKSEGYKRSGDSQSCIQRSCRTWPTLEWFICPFHVYIGPCVYRRAHAYPLPGKMPARAEKSSPVRTLARYAGRLEAGAAVSDLHKAGSHLLQAFWAKLKPQGCSGIRPLHLKWLETCLLLVCTWTRPGARTTVYRSYIKPS